MEAEGEGGWRGGDDVVDSARHGVRGWFGGYNAGSSTLTFLRMGWGGLMEQVLGRRAYIWNGRFVGLRGLWQIYTFLGMGSGGDVVWYLPATTLNRDIISRIRNAWRGCQFAKWGPWTGIRGLICRRVLIHSLYGACSRRPS